MVMLWDPSSQRDKEMQTFEAESQLVCLGFMGNLNGWNKVNAWEKTGNGQRCNGKQIMLGWVLYRIFALFWVTWKVI